MTSELRKVVVLTPPGRSAIATIRVEGADALACVSRCLTSRNNSPVKLVPGPKPILARFRLPLGSAEEVVLNVLNHECLEIHCHGSPLVIRQITESMEKMGFSPEGCDAWIDRTEPNRIAAEARRSLCSAMTFRVVPFLIDQYHGALHQSLLQIREFIRSRDTNRALTIVNELLQYGEFGRHLITPWNVVIVGPPNVGKSSLFNRLLGYERAIVDAVPGTTRDFVTATTAFEGWPIELCDTAGLREASHPIEKEGTQRTVALADSADLVLLVFTKDVPWSQAWELWIDRWPRHLIVYNKSDLPSTQDNRPAGLDVSARSGYGMKALEQEIARRLVPVLPQPGAPIPFTERQIDHLRRAQRSLQEGNLSEVERHLGELLE